MTLKVDRRSAWHDPNFEPNEGPAKFDDQFSQVDQRGLGLRPFIEQQTQIRAANSTGGTQTLIRGKAFLRQMPWGEFELSIFRGRNTYDTYYSYDRDELVRYAASLQEGS